MRRVDFEKNIFKGDRHFNFTGLIYYEEKSKQQNLTWKMPIAPVWSLAEGTALSQQSVRDSLAEIHHWCNKGYLHVLGETRISLPVLKKIFHE